MASGGKGTATFRTVPATIECAPSETGHLEPMQSDLRARDFRLWPAPGRSSKLGIVSSHRRHGWSTSTADATEVNERSLTLVDGAGRCRSPQVPVPRSRSAPMLRTTVRRPAPGILIRSPMGLPR